MEGINIQMNVQKIHETKFSSDSVMDGFGRVFFHDEKVYRAVTKDKVEYCIALLNSGLYKELREKEYIPETNIAQLQIANYDLVLEHERVTQTYRNEWTFSMLKDAALAILSINKICNKHGYELKDAHLTNVLFKGVKPVWVDLGSIVPLSAGQISWRGYTEFLNVVIIPLAFLSAGNIYIGRKLLDSYHYVVTTLPSQDIMQSGLLKLLPEANSASPFYFKFRNKTLLKTITRSNLLSLLSYWSTKMIRSILGRNTIFLTYSQEEKKSQTLHDLFPEKQIESYLNSLQVFKNNTPWQGYHRNYNNDNGEIVISGRFKKIIEVVKSLNEVTTTLDLAGNEGLLSQLLFENISELKRIIIADYDENAIDFAYNKFKCYKTDKLNTVLLNLMYTQNIEDTQKRLRSDLVLALAITHHLILTMNYSLPGIFERIKAFSKKYVMIEFMPLGLWSSNSEIVPDLPEWYNVEWFRKEFKNYFILLYEEQLEKNRILFLGKIIE